MKKILASFLIAIFASTTAAASGIDPQNRLELGFGLILSSDYSDRIDEVYSAYDASGGGGWLKFDVNYVDQLTGPLYMHYRFTFGLNGAVVDGGDEDETYLNALFIPAIGLRLELASIYFFGLGNLPIPYSTSDYRDFKTGNPGFELGIGTRLGSRGFIEASYLSAPIEIDSKTRNYGGGPTLTAGFRL